MANLQAVRVSVLGSDSCFFLKQNLNSNKNPMIVSMTGFGNASFENSEMIAIAEIKSLNSKFLDINLRLPKGFSLEKELVIRNLLKDKLQRGKITASLDIQYKELSESNVKINREILKSHYRNIQAIAEELGANQNEILRLAMQMPDVVNQELSKEEIDEQEWTIIQKVLYEALDQCHDFRQNEGLTLEKSFEEYIGKIQDLLRQIVEQDPKRLTTIKERIQNRVMEIRANDLFDPNRFEQEMIYYIEKLDITEEKVRLAKHLHYFLETLQSSDSNGKKLNFITQELGREINTIGAKANDADIQRMVVSMKEELEKVKEQILNIL